MKKTVLLLVLMIPCVVLAQFKVTPPQQTVHDQLNLAQQAAKTVTGILGLDPSRFSMQHSYQMSYMTAGGNGYSQGLYLNTMSYEFDIPLTLSLQLGYAHQPFQGMNNSSPLFQNGMFVSNASLRYQPSDRTTIHLQFSQRPYQSRYGMYSRYDDPFYQGW